MQKRELTYTVLTANSDDGPVKLLAATDASGGLWIARASIQSAMGGVDFSKSYSDQAEAHCGASVKKGESQGLLNDGRACVFVTTGLARTIVAEPRYFKAKDDLRAAILDAIELFTASGCASGAKEPMVKCHTPKPMAAPETIADKKSREYARPPETAADSSADIMKAVNEATAVPLPEEALQTIVGPAGSKVVGGATLHFMGRAIPVIVLETFENESTTRKAYVSFNAICEAIGLDPEHSMMAVSSILNTGLAPKWGLDMVNIVDTGKGVQCKSVWIMGARMLTQGDLDTMDLSDPNAICLSSVYSWLSTYELHMKRLYPKLNCRADSRTIGIYQTGFKEVAMKFLGDLMKADKDKQPFNKQKFLEQVKANKGAKVPSDAAKEPEVLEPKVTPIEEVVKSATEAYATGGITSVEESAGVSEYVRKQLSDVPKAAQHADYDDDDFLFDNQTVSGPFEVPRDQFMDLKFMDDHIGIIDLNGGRYVSIRGICKNLGLNIAGQFEKLKNNPKFTCMDIRTRDSLGRAAELLCLKAKQVPTWLSEINVSKIAPAIRPKLLAYQEDLMEAIYQYHTAGVAVNKAIVPPVISAEIQVLLDAVKQTNEMARQMMQANQRLAIDSQETLEFAVDKTENLINQASAEVAKARQEAEAAEALRLAKDAEAVAANRAAFAANKAKDSAELTLNQVLRDYEPAVEKAQAFDELVYSGPSKNITTIAKECGLGSGTELNSLLEDLGMIIKHRRYPNTWEPSAKMMRMVPIGTKLGCIEAVGKGNAHTVPKFGHTTTVQCWAWMPAGELLIKRIVSEYLQGRADAKAATAHCKPDCQCQGPVVGLQSQPPAEPFPGKPVQGVLDIEEVDGGTMP